MFYPFGFTDKANRTPQNELNCIAEIDAYHEDLHRTIVDIPNRMETGITLNFDKFHDKVRDPKKIQHDEQEYVYYYHGDHLGSASWITNYNGDAVQHLQYLPYGEPYINQHPYGYSERFTFTGKERDEETGYGYFGARYMDHELMTMWLSVDPMADKYPSISPYAYCAWNPVKLVDPDGREVTITGATGKTYYWYKGSLYTHKSHAKQYKVSDSDLNKIYNKGDNVTYNVTKNLESMYGKRQGKKVLDALSGSGMTFNISSDIPSSGDASYANKEVKLGTRHRSLLALSHELFHAYQDYKGRNGRSIYNEVEAYIFQAIIDGNTEGITSRNGDKKYNSAGKSLVTSFSESDFNYVLSNFQATSVANSSGAYRKERYEFNPLNLKAKDSLLKDL
jgi:RHS repeat-associated protein